MKAIRLKLTWMIYGNRIHSSGYRGFVLLEKFKQLGCTQENKKAG
jgi:hypothetical protein